MELTITKELIPEMSNSDNPRKGAEFQLWVMEWFSTRFHKRFETEVKIPIGSDLLDPSEYKPHKFDIVSDDQSIIIECKRYTWTETYNVPSAKMGFTNEAAFYLSLAKKSHKKYIAMIKSYNPKRKETLAEYYYRTNRHLLGDVIIAEFDPDTNDMRFLNEDAVNAIWVKRINSFAQKYLNLYESTNTVEDDVCSTFANECFALGIQMDCEKGFLEAYGSKAIQNAASFKSQSQEIKDADLLASEIFSRWRYITHWSNGESCLDRNNKEWFLVAFRKLLDLTA